FLRCREGAGRVVEALRAEFAHRLSALGLRVPHLAFADYEPPPRTKKLKRVERLCSLESLQKNCEEAHASSGYPAQYGSVDRSPSLGRISPRAVLWAWSRCRLPQRGGEAAHSSIRGEVASRLFANPPGESQGRQPGGFPPVLSHP